MFKWPGGGPRKTFPEVVSGSVCMLKFPYIDINVGTVELQKSFKYVTLWNSMYIMMTVVMTLKISRTSVTSVDIGTVSDAAQPYFKRRGLLSGKRRLQLWGIWCSSMMRPMPETRSARFSLHVVDQQIGVSYGKLMLCEVICFKTESSRSCLRN